MTALSDETGSEIAGNFFSKEKKKMFHLSYVDFVHALIHYFDYFFIGIRGVRDTQQIVHYLTYS